MSWLQALGSDCTTSPHQIEQVVTESIGLLPYVVESALSFLRQRYELERLMIQ